MGRGVSSLIELMDEIGDTLRELSSPEMPVQVEPRMNLNPTPPSIDVYPGDPFVDDAGAGFTDLDGSVYFTVRARVSTADSYAGQELLLAFMDSGGPLSVQAALAADDTLNGLASQVVVEGPTPYSLFIDSGAEGALLGCTWRVQLLNAVS
jgi:hypothetical protein